MSSGHYKDQVDLLLRIIPHVAKESCFALKGGTAINLFVWDMPRLSVDIDLTYVAFDTRAVALGNIADALLRIQKTIQKSIAGIKVETLHAGNDPVAKLVCTYQALQVKIEANTIMRGCTKPCRVLPLSNTAQNEFNKFVEIQIVSNAELFGGKICAALDRQHPRDLFDIKQLFERDGITQDIKEGFLVCLLSSNRPIYEVLQPNFQDQTHVFDHQFKGMANLTFSYHDYEETRERLVKEIHSLLTDKDKQLLLSIKDGNPDWSLCDITKLQDLPAVKWKLKNIQKLKKHDPQRHGRLLDLLETIL